MPHVTEILLRKKLLAGRDLKAAISQLSRDIDDLKTGMRSQLVSKQNFFLPCYRDAEHLSSSLQIAIEDVDEVWKRIEDNVKPRFAQLTNELEFLSRELNTIEESSTQVHRYAQLHELLEEAEARFVAEDLLACSQLLEEVGSVMSELEGGPEVQIIEALRKEHAVRSERLTYKLSKVWKRYIAWKVGRTPHFTEVTVATVQTEEADAFARLVEAFQKQGLLCEKMSRFGRSLLDNMVTPMVQYESAIVTSPESPTFLVEFNESKAPLVKDMIENLSVLFTFLASRLRARDVVSADPVKIMGSVIGKEFSDTVAKCCLEPAAPSDVSLLDNCPASVLLDFHNQLVSANFLSSEEAGFSSLIANLESCISQQRQRSLLQARSIVKQELHPTVVVGEPPLDREEGMTLEHYLDRNPFKFPKCKVSKFMEELVTLLKTMVDEDKDGSDDCCPEQAWQVGAVRDICELYCCVAPLHHQHAIQTIPQQTAIHHNNCLYLAHELLCLGVQLHGRTILVDLASKLRSIGKIALYQQIDNQRRQLLGILKEAPAPENSKDIDEALRRGLFHLEQLKRVWVEVLPITSYLEAVGSLLNTVLEYVIKRVVSMEDITSTLSEKLAQVIEKVADKAIAIFDIPGCSSEARILASGHALKWRKFCELKNLLRFSLKEIMDRWADGNGPLACFTPEELQRLIRALFQNTGRRAAALAQITKHYRVKQGWPAEDIDQESKNIQLWWLRKACELWRGNKPDKNKA